MLLFVLSVIVFVIVFGVLGLCLLIWWRCRFRAMSKELKKHDTIENIIIEKAEEISQRNEESIEKVLDNEELQNKLSETGDKLVDL